MTEDRKKLIQAILVILLLAAAARLALIFYQRHEGGRVQPGPGEPSVARPMDPNYYVVPKKLHAYDLKSAQQLARQPVWVKEGYRYTYYRYDAARRRADLSREAGLLGALEKLQVGEVVVDRGAPPGSPAQVMAVFDKGGQPCAVPIGQARGNDYRIFADEIFFLEDPRQLYQWPAETWQAIDAHQARPGMDEIQAVFALGMGVPRKSYDSETKTVDYPNGGEPVVITYRNGRAVDIQKGTKP